MTRAWEIFSSLVVLYSGSVWFASEGVVLLVKVWFC